MRILFVDDNFDTCEIFRFGLELAGQQVQTAPGGAEALQFREQQHFDAMVLDIDMPVMNGWTTLLKLRQMPQCQNLPVIMLTAYFEPNFDSEAVGRGADFYLHKPIMPDQLLNHIRECVRRRQEPADTSPSKFFQVSR